MWNPLASVWSSSLPFLRKLKRAVEQMRLALRGPASRATVALPAGKSLDPAKYLELRLRLLPEKPERLLPDGDGVLYFNVAGFRGLTRRRSRAAVRAAFAHAQIIAANAGKILVRNFDIKSFNDDLLALIDHPDFGGDVLDQLLYAISNYRSSPESAGSAEIWTSQSTYAAYDIAKHHAAVRYGSVELRVVEDYLTDPRALRRALEGILRIAHNEKKMYAETKAPHGDLSTTDPEWNLRRLMTNSGFYFEGNLASAWETLEEWANRYISALQHSHLIWHGKHARYYWKIQRNLHERFGVVPRYIRQPGVYDFYESVQNKEVLFASPLAQLVREQAASGRLQKLYKDFEVPLFSVRTVQAWISTWPNRPHSSWSDTFGRLCEAIEQEYRAKPFEVFVASCGCYGLPLCDFVRNRYGCSVLYIGHFSHVAFGVGVRVALGPMRARPNPENWVHSDLGRYPNMDRIDRGRYV